MKITIALKRAAEDSQNCYVYEHVGGPGGLVIKVWVPRRLVRFNPPGYVDARLRGISERAAPTDPPPPPASGAAPGK